MTTSEMIDYLVSKTDPKNGTMEIEYNPHLKRSSTIEKYFKDFEGSVDIDFIDDKDREKCIKENKMWSMRWYIHGSGFLGINASSLDLCIKFLCDLRRQEESEK